MEDIKFNISPSGQELTILTGKAENPIEPRSYQFQGDIKTVAVWLTTKSSDVDILKACVQVNLRQASITLKLNIDQENQRQLSSVFGMLQPFEDHTAFRINTGQKWELADLSNFLKFNRRYFPDKTENMTIVSGLKQFKAQVTRDVEKNSDDRGNHRRLDEKRVHTDLPETFTLHMPIFHNETPIDFDVEILIEEKEGIVRAILQSVSLLEKRETYIRQAIEEELKSIKPLGITIIYE